MVKKGLHCRVVIRHQRFTLSSCSQTRQMVLGKQMCHVCLSAVAHLVHLDDRLKHIFILILYLECSQYARGSDLPQDLEAMLFSCSVWFSLSLFTTQGSKEQFQLKSVLHFVSHCWSWIWWGMWRATRKVFAGTSAAKGRPGKMLLLNWAGPLVTKDMENIKVLNASFTLTGKTGLQESLVPETRGQVWSKENTQRRMWWVDPGWMPDAH